MQTQAQSINASGSDVEAAIQAGLARLGLTRDQVDVEVIQEPSRGVLRLRTREAIVRLTEILPAPHIEPPPQLPVRPEPRAIEPSRAPSTPDWEHEPSESAEAPSEALTEADILAIARDVLANLLDRMQIQAEIQTSVVEPRNPGDGKTLILDLRGNDLGFLIGRKGETLSALQHVVRLIVNKEIQQRANVMVDIGGYKSRRESALRKLALRVADQVTRRRSRIALEPMTAYERRIIHMTLRNHPTVTTESVGERDHRKVTIVPKS